MTPKNKAQELVEEFSLIECPCFNGNIIELEQIGFAASKECALIMVDNILKKTTRILSCEELYYWNEVREEINKL
jgi:hypothetical protein